MSSLRQVLVDNMNALVSKMSTLVEIDQSTFDALPRTQRLKLAKKARQEQLRRYHAWEREERRQGRDSPKARTPNKRGTRVNFQLANQLRDAVTRYDIKEVLALLERGADPNTSSESGVTVLHQCCLDDNLAAAEVLVSRGANINAQDDDWWTPLHAACACDYAELALLLLKSGADVTLLDIDGNVPLDHAAEGSETRMVMEEYMKQVGVDDGTLKGVKKREADRMLSDVREFLLTGGNVNATNDSNTSLLHIAAANDYREVAKFLLDRSADLDGEDDEGMTALHLAARFGHTKMVKLLVRRNANPKIANVNNERPMDLAATELIQEVLKTAAQEYIPHRVNPAAAASKEEVYEELPGSAQHDGVVRLNSKNLRARSSSLSKTEEIFEAQTRLPDDIALDDSSHIRCLGLKVVPEDDAVYLPATSSTDDLTSMSELSQNMILQELMLRYSKDVIYTYVGDILIAVNPFKSLPIYSARVSGQYLDLADRRSLTPHIFSVADRAYRAMVREGQPQCCIVSGESGAGKTESVKYFVQHLLMTAQSEESLLNEKIQQVNPLLECFGNAQTEMNDNSSRFGKYLELVFGRDGRVHGANLSEYLLEKSRVVRQGERERNFHIFYLMYAGLSEEEKIEYGLSSAENHRYLNRGNDVRKAVNTACQDKFKAVRDCLQLIGFSRDDEDSLFRTLAAVLHLGDLRFTQSDKDMARLVNQEVLDKVALLLQVSADELGGAIMSETTYTRGEAITKLRTVDQAEECRDALAKAIYSRLFSWVVNNINQLLQPVEDTAPTYEIGVLDIFGFENFNLNSLEQVCINLANEQLQSFFNEHIFLKEQDDCESEGIDLERINFTNNKPCLNLFLERHTGILALIDEESHFPKGTDKSLATKLHSGLAPKARNIYFAPKDGGLTFGILHYAGIVNYELDGFLEKNRDTLAKSVHFTMKTSCSPLIQEMFQNKVTRTGSVAPSVRQRATRKSRKQSAKNTKDAFAFFRQKRMSDRESLRKKKYERPAAGTERKGAATVLYHFKNSLLELVGKMTSASPHFVRCIKPNTAKLPDKFTPEYVIAQLRYTGIMETTRIRQQGFPLRLKPEDFVQQYKALVSFSTDWKLRQSDLDRCKATLKHNSIVDWKLGKSSKLFFHHQHAEKLRELSSKLERKVLTCQKVARGFLSRLTTKSILLRWRQQKEVVAAFFSDVVSRGEAFYEVQENGNDHDEVREVQKVVLDAYESGQSNDAVLPSSSAESSGNGTPRGRSCQSIVIESDYTVMTGDARQSSSLEEEEEFSYEDMLANSYPDSDVYIKEVVDRRPSVLPYQLTTEQLRTNREKCTAPPASAPNGGARQRDSAVFDDPIYATQFAEPAKETPTTTTRTSSQGGMDARLPGGPGVLPPPPPPANGHMTAPEAHHDPSALADLPPPPPPVEDLGGEEHLAADLPPPPPMSDVSVETKQKISNIRARFLQEEKENGEPASAAQKRWSNPPRLSEDGEAPDKARIAAFRAKLESADQEEPAPALEKPRPRPLSGTQLASPSFPPAAPPEAPRKESPQSAASPSGVKKRPPAPSRDPNTRLTMTAEQMVQHQQHHHHNQDHKLRSVSTSDAVLNQFVYPTPNQGRNARPVSESYGMSIPPPPHAPAPKPPQPPQPPQPQQQQQQQQQQQYHQPPQAFQSHTPQASHQQPLYGNVDHSGRGHHPDQRHVDPRHTDQPVYGNMEQPAYGNIDHQGRQSGPAPQPIYGNVDQPGYAYKESPTPYAEFFQNIPPPPSEPPPPVPTASGNVFTQIPGALRASQPPPLPPGGPPPAPMAGGPPEPPPGPAPPPPPGLPPTPMAPPPPPPPSSAPPMGAPSHGGGLLDDIKNKKLTSVPGNGGERQRKKSDAPMDNLMAELSSRTHGLRPTPKPAKGPTTEGQVTEPDELAKTLNKRQAPPVSPSKPAKAPPPAPAPKTPKSPGPSAQSPTKPIPSVAPKPKKSVDGPPPPAPPPASNTQAPPPFAAPPPSGPGGRAPPAPPAAKPSATPAATPSAAAPPPSEPGPEEGLPAWKKAMKEKKMKEQQDKEQQEAMKKQEEEARWKDIPEWKRKMIQVKEKKKAEEQAATVDPDKEERDAKLKAMPTWKRNLVLKKSSSEEANNNGAE